MCNPKYPNIYVPLAGEDGNAFAIVGRVAKALRAGGVSEKEISTYKAEACAGSYNELLSVTMDWVHEGTAPETDEIDNDDNGWEDEEDPDEFADDDEDDDDYLDDSTEDWK
jgi:hypothetical protein